MVSVVKGKHLIPVRVKCPEHVCQKPFIWGQNVLEPFAVRAVVQELTVCQELGRFVAPVTMVKHVWSNVEVAQQYDRAALSQHRIYAVPQHLKNIEQALSDSCICLLVSGSQNGHACKGQYRGRPA